MKICPGCKAEIIDTAKFCNKCGFNVKKYEEEKASEKAFCTECGAQIPCGSAFCPECGLPVGTEGSTDIAAPALTEPFADTSSGFDTGWLSGLEVSSEREELRPFEYVDHNNGTYTVTGLRDKHLPAVVVPDGVIAIGDGAFEGSEAVSIELPEGLSKIGNGAFKGLKDLCEISLPLSLLLVGDEAFMDCQSLDIELPPTVRKVGKDALKNTARDIERRKAADQQRADEERQRQAEEERKYRKYTPGSIITLGTYEQGDGKCDIEWIVIDLNKKDNLVLLISKYIIECKEYDEDEFSVTWGKSTVRSWLNREFLLEAFNYKEGASWVQSDFDFVKTINPDTNAGVGGDRVFLLSNDEVERHLKNNDIRKCKTTRYVEEKGIYKYLHCDDNHYGNWWLRTNGSDEFNASYVSYDGTLDREGMSIDNCVGVRPAMWIKIK